MSKGIKAFITYAHSDSRQKDELQKRLAVMKQNGEIAAWDDNQILAGDEWEKEISTHLAGSDILLYLVSATSLASENCNKELVEALKTTNTKPISIILEACHWGRHYISKFEVLPDKGKAINKWSPRSDGWQNVVEGIEKTVKAIQKVKAEPPANEQKKRKFDALLLFQQANFLLLLGQFDQAIQAYSGIINRNPNFDGAHNNRGNAYVGIGKYDKAIADYDRAVELKPDDADAYNNRGTAYSDKGDYDRAIADYDKAIVLDPDLSDAYYNRGIAYDAQGKYDKAIVDYDMAIALNPENANAYNNRGAVYADISEYVRAIADYDKAIELNPDLAVTYCTRGFAYHRKGEYARAILDYDKAIALDPDDAVTYSNRGEAFLHLERWEEARRDLQTARDRGIDIITSFNNDYESVADFESKTGITPPADIAEMLTRKPDEGKT